jgi:chemosensory pili system protein ChpA (sensor histidine kinase/response regulator)
MEAWDTVAAIEDAMLAIKGETADTGAARVPPASVGSPEAARAADTLALVTHRLRGSAALNGFAGVARIAEAMETIVDRSRTADLVAAVGPLGELLAALKSALDVVAAGGEGESDAITAALIRAATVLRATPALRLLAELDRFYAEAGDVLQYFGPEAAEHLETMGEALLALDRGEDHAAEIGRLFRAVHTLKGAAYTVGCRVIGDVTHRVEDLLGAVRDGHLELSPAVIEATFASLDALRALTARDAETMERRAALLERAEALLDALPLPDRAAATPTAATAPTRLETPPALQPPPARVDPAVQPAPGFVPPIALPAPAPVALAGGRPRTAPASGPQASGATIRVAIDRLDGLMNLVGELVTARSRLEQRLNDFERAVELLGLSRSRMGRIADVFERKYANPRMAPTPPAAVASDLIQRFGELEFDRYDDFAILARSAAELSNDLTEVEGQLHGLVRSIRDDAGRVQRLAGDLRAEITRVRMVPVGRLFARCARQVRETARSEGKSVVLEASGDAVEMDNTIVEQVADPILHLLRNAIAHGIEPVEERRRLGKPESGTLRLAAYQKGAAIHIEVADDGRGIDPALLKRWAIERGFVNPEAAASLADRDALDLIFLPGFSTAAAVTTAAGRGVGMDVVRTNIGRLGGHIDVETEIGVGTRFTIKLPLTVTISNAFFVRVGTETFAVPVSSVVVVTRCGVDDVVVVDGGEKVAVEGQLVDLVRLDRALDLPGGATGSQRPVLAVRAAGRRMIGLVVDEVLGKDDIVVKSLGEFLQGTCPFSGATLTGDGRVILMLDPARLVERRASSMRRSVSRRIGGSGAATPSRRCVLLVDDSISIRKVVGQMLERGGFRVVTAADGVEALERASETPIDVVVTDLEMPRLNGYELIRDLKRRPATRDVPVVVLTTRAGGKHADLARHLGVSHYVPKPVHESAFLDLVRGLVSPMPASAVAVP